MAADYYLNVKLKRTQNQVWPGSTTVHQLPVVVDTKYDHHSSFYRLIKIRLKVTYGMFHGPMQWLQTDNHESLLFSWTWQLIVEKEGSLFKAVLEIKNVAVEDAGKYKVTAKNELGESNATISLNFDSKFCIISFQATIFYSLLLQKVLDYLVMNILDW